MSDRLRFEDLDPDVRAEFCAEVLERLSELIEDEAPEDFCERVAALMGDCTTLAVFRRTLAATIELAGEAGRLDPQAPPFDEQTFTDCVEKVRRRLAPSS